MKETLFDIVHINEEVVFKFYAVYYYKNKRKFLNLHLSFKNFNLAVGCLSKRVTLIPDYKYNIEYTITGCKQTENKKEFDEFMDNECLKIFKIEPKELFNYLIKRNLYRFVASKNCYNQLNFKREDDSTIDYKDSIRNKNSSVCGISWSTLSNAIGSHVYTNSKDRDLFNQESLERETIEIDIDKVLKIPSEISFYCNENPYQLELDFGEN